MDYTMGLDIGITSVGWAVLENDLKGEPKRIADLGVRIFDRAENPKDGSSLAEPRREARGTRRRLRRRRHRLERLKQLLEQEGLIETEAFMARYQSKGLPDVYRLRYEALERVVTGEELAQILLHIAKHRGFQSNRRAELKDKENGKVLAALSENEQIMKEKQYRTVGEMLYLDERFKKAAYGSGQEQIANIRNHGGDYQHTIKRSMLVEEINQIFEAQRQMGSRVATEELQQAYLEILQNRRSFDEGPGLQADGSPSPYGGDMIGKMVGKCTLDETQPRAAKACFTSERFVMAQKLSHLRIRNARGEQKSLGEWLSPEDNSLFDMIEEMAYQQKKGVSYTAIRNRVSLPEEWLFSDLSYGDGDSKGKKGKSSKKTKAGQEVLDNPETIKPDIKKTESTICVKLPCFHQIREALGNYDLDNLYNENFVACLDEIATILTLYKSDDVRKKHLEDMTGIELSAEETDRLLELDFSKFQHLSLKVMKQLIPYLEQGFTYDKACQEAGYAFRAERQGEKFHVLKGKEIKELIDNIPNPVVKRAVSQTFKVINAIIYKYGSPQAIHIELARELGKSRQDRDELTRRNKENEKANERVKNHLKELGVENPKNGDVLKFRLWQEQGECCMYSGRHIAIDKLFSNEYAEIDHIVPYSKTFDNGYSNKVLVLTEENRNKGNRLPYEAFGAEAQKWSDFENRVERYIKDYHKKKRLLKQKLTDEDIRAGKQRNINDTRYITTFVMNVLQDYLEFAPYQVEGKVRRVIPVNGRVTNFLRVRWGRAKKDRSTDTHHAEDAVLIACCTPKMIRRITNNLQAKEIGYSQKLALYDEETGETFYRKDYSDEAWIKRFGTRIDWPWTEFGRELDFRMSPDPQEFIRRFPKEYDKFDYPEGEEEKIRPIFVSRMPRHKVTGAEREDTIRSPRHFEEQALVISKVPLSSLRLDKDGKVAGPGTAKYYKPETDLLLYQALKKQLELYDGNAEAAFQEDFYKPKADGSRGPLVRKVKVIDKMTLGVLVNLETVDDESAGTEGKKKARGIAENGNMIRVDVFCENGKYYFVPIYVLDTKKKELPRKAVVPHKPYAKWKEMKEENFLFSLYYNDLFYFEHSKGMPGKTNQDVPCVLNKCICYFNGANIASGNFNGFLHDNSARFESMGIQRLVQIKKYQVDVLGNVTEVKKEKRMHFRG